jgi:ABC-2 type transport system ATP-binding protein
VPAVVVEGLDKAYGSVEAVRDVSFEVSAGEVFALLGPNGAGKTTTIEILEGFRARDRGRVSVLGLDPADRSSSRQFRERLGVVLQELAVEPFLTVRQVLTRNAGYFPNPRPVDEVIAAVGLSEKAHAWVKTLSGGQQRRLDMGPASSATRNCSFWTSRPPASTRRPAKTRGRWSGRCAGRERR